MVTPLAEIKMVWMLRRSRESRVKICHRVFAVSGLHGRHPGREGSDRAAARPAGAAFSGVSVRAALHRRQILIRQAALTRSYGENKITAPVKAGTVIFSLTGGLPALRGSRAARDLSSPGRRSGRPCRYCRPCRPAQWGPRWRSCPPARKQEAALPRPPASACRKATPA